MERGNAVDKADETRQPSLERPSAVEPQRERSVEDGNVSSAPVLSSSAENKPDRSLWVAWLYLFD